VSKEAILEAILALCANLVSFNCNLEGVFEVVNSEPLSVVTSIRRAL